MRLSQAQRLAAVFVCLFFLVVSGNAQADKEPFKFGEFDVELLEQANVIDKKFAEQGLVYRDAALTGYLQQIGQSLLAPDEKLEKVTWQFFVFRNPTINAFALPNGSIYVNTGLLATLDTESQVASVLAHEIVHVRNRHTYLGYRSYRKKALAINLLSIAGAYGGSVVGLASSAAQFILNVTIIGHSREMEREADTQGAHALLKSVYEPQEMLTAFKRLQNEYEVDLDGEPFYGDHPKLKERMAYLTVLLEQAKEKRAFTAEEQAAFKERYFKQTEAITRHNIELDIDAGLFRTAVALGQQLVELNPQSAANLTSLADAYVALGPRVLTPTAEEKTGHGKRDARKRRTRLTLLEERKKLAETTAGQDLQKANFTEADKLYHQALALDGQHALAWRGLGELLEEQTQGQPASEAYQHYVELNPGAMDRLMIMRRIKALEEKNAASPKPQL